MSPRDAYLRITPYELALPDPEAAETRFAAIAEEARSRGTDPGDPRSFLLLGQVGRLLRDLREGEPSPDLLHTFGAFLYQAFHFHEAGKRCFLAETPAVRYLLEADAAPEGWSGDAPVGAGYVQLPRHLVWARPSGTEGHAEAVDGVFFTLTGRDSLVLLAVTGIREDRPGFSVLPVPPVPVAEAGEWLRRPAREIGDDFETTLPGGELDRLYSVETAAEVLKLTARLLAYVRTVEGALGPEEPPAGEPGASRLPARRIRLTG